MTAASRREAIRRAALAAGAIAAAGALPALLRPAAARAQASEPERLRDFLAPAIALEQIGELAYSTAAQTAGGGARRSLERLRDQEQAHADALRSALDSLGYDLPEEPEAADDAEVFDVEGIDEERRSELTDLLEGLETLEREGELLDYLISLERAQTGYYLEAAPELESEDLARTSAELVASHAQQLVVLRLARGEDPGAAARGIGGAGGGE